MSRYTQIIFDVDGTLIDTEDAALGALQETLPEIGHSPMDRENLKFALGIPGEDTFSILGAKDVETAVAIWNKNMQKRFALGIKVFDGIEKVLEEIQSAGLELGIITSKTREEYNDSFGLLPVSRYFQITICADDSEKHKPNPEPMYSYLKKSGAEKDKVIFIGDSVYDMKCAASAGVESALALWGCPNPDNIEATYYLKRPQEILKVLNL